MRGGAIPALAWGTLLLVLFALNWIWEGRLVQVGSTTYALVAIYGTGLGLWLVRREALSTGEPSAPDAPEALPESSTGAVLAGLAIACILFGIVWAQFLIFFGAGMLVLALGRTVVELRAQRRAREAAMGQRAIAEREP